MTTPAPVPNTVDLAAAARHVMAAQTYEGGWAALTVWCVLIDTEWGRDDDRAAALALAETLATGPALLAYLPPAPFQ